MGFPRGTEATQCGYAPVNGLQLYYEIGGAGEPLVFIPAAFQSAGMHSFPLLTSRHSLITVDLQGHGRTADIPDRPLSIEQYAEDVAALLGHLGIPRADFFGESYGANTVVLLAARYPALVRRGAAYSATFGPARVALNSETTRFERPPTADSSNIQYQRERYQAVAPEPAYWPKLWSKLTALHWEGLAKEELASIRVPLLLLCGDHDFVSVEHTVASARLIPSAELAVIPSASHFALSSEPERVIPLVEHFFAKPEQELPLATAELGYYPGRSR
jgi:pimeloyl-ACP methyl ester carboxylesterase